MHMMVEFCERSCKTVKGGDASVAEKLLSVKDVAEWLAVSERTVFNLLERGEITSTRVGNRHRFEPDVIRAYLARQQSLPPEHSPA